MFEMAIQSKPALLVIFSRTAFPAVSSILMQELHSTQSQDDAWDEESTLLSSFHYHQLHPHHSLNMLFDFPTAHELYTSKNDSLPHPSSIPSPAPPTMKHFHSTQHKESESSHVLQSQNLHEAFSGDPHEWVVPESDSFPQHAGTLLHHNHSPPPPTCNPLTMTSLEKQLIPTVLAMDQKSQWPQPSCMHQPQKDLSTLSLMGMNRVSRELSLVQIRVRSEADVLCDGYRWRKYGEKTIKNRRFRRSYYICSESGEGCVVRKRLERSSSDPSIVLATYDGRHNHASTSNMINA